jgi:hypothetical protein
VKLQFTTDVATSDRVQRLADALGTSVSAALAMLVRTTLNGDADVFASLAARHGYPLSRPVQGSRR